MSRRAQFVRNAVHFLIYVVVAVRIDKAHLRAQQLVYKQIAYPSLNAALLEHKHGLYAYFVAACRGEHGVVALRPAGGQHVVRALFLCVVKQIFKLAHLVAAGAYAGHIVALDVYIAAECAAHVVQMVHGRGELAKVQFIGLVHGYISSFNLGMLRKSNVAK